MPTTYTIYTSEDRPNYTQQHNTQFTYNSIKCWRWTCGRRESGVDRSTSTVCLWSRRSTQLQHTDTAHWPNVVPKRRTPSRQTDRWSRTTRCVGCAQLEHALSPPTCQRSIAHMYAQSTTFFLYGIPYASKCMHMHALATVRAVRACAMHATERLCCFFSPS